MRFLCDSYAIPMRFLCDSYAIPRGDSEAILSHFPRGRAGTPSESVAAEWILEVSSHFSP